MANKNRIAALFGKVLELPWEKVVTWVIVGSLAAWLKDFFGVRLAVGSAAAPLPLRACLGCPRAA